MKYWTERADIPSDQLLAWAGLQRSKYHQWRKRYGKVNENDVKACDWWLEEWGKQAILDFRDKNPLEGY